MSQTSKFNTNLTPAQVERLTMLAEEAAEIVTATTKALRHGLHSYHPSDPDYTPNGLNIDREITDFLAVLHACRLHGDLPRATPTTHQLAQRWANKLKWTHYQHADVDHLTKLAAQASAGMSLYNMSHPQLIETLLPDPKE
jgi:hypothetical protein